MPRGPFSSCRYQSRGFRTERGCDVRPRACLRGQRRIGESTPSSRTRQASRASVRGRTTAARIGASVRWVIHGRFAEVNWPGPWSISGRRFPAACLSGFGPGFVPQVVDRPRRGARPVPRHSSTIVSARSPSASRSPWPGLGLPHSSRSLLPSGSSQTAPLKSTRGHPRARGSGHRPISVSARCRRHCSSQGPPGNIKSALTRVQNSATPESHEPSTAQRCRNQRNALAAVWSSTQKWRAIRLTLTPGLCIAAASAAINW